MEIIKAYGMKSPILWIIFLFVTIMSCSTVILSRAAEPETRLLRGATVVEFENENKNMRIVEDADASGGKTVIHELLGGGKNVAFSMPVSSKGKYRIKIRLKVSNPQSEMLYGTVCLVCFDGNARALNSIKTHPGFSRPYLPLISITDRKFHELSFEAWVSKAGLQSAVLKFISPNQKPDVTIGETVSLDSVELEALDHEIGIEEVVTEKVFYYPNETVKAKATINNLTENVVRGEFRAVLKWYMEKKRAVFSEEVALKPKECREMEFSFPMTAGGDDPSEKWGCELEATVMDGTGSVMSQMSQLFTSAKSVVRVLVYDIWPPSMTGYFGDIRKNWRVPELVNCVEVFTPWPDDWGALSPKEDSWYQGQSGAKVEKGKIKKVIADCHRRGRKALFYSRGDSYGKYGFELARKHPEYFTDIASAGCGDWDSWCVHHWDEVCGKLGRTPHSSMLTFKQPNLKNNDAQKHMLGQWLKTTKEYGWDGFRYDGLLWILNSEGKIDDKKTGEMFRRLRDDMKKQYPLFIFGNNAGLNNEIRIQGKSGIRFVSNYGETTDTLAAYCEEDGLILNEGVNNISTWETFVDDVAMQNDFIHENGGQMIVHMNGLGSRYGLYGSLDNHYGNIVTLASGGHLSAWASVRGAYTPFAVRFSKFIWDPNLKRVSAENMLSVKADKPLWFEKFVKIIDNGKSRIVVAHLINPPLGKSPSSRTPAEGNAAVNQLPQPVEHALVSINIPDGYTMRKAWWAVPEPDVTLKSLEFKKRESLSEIRIPPFWTWGMIVVEMKRDPEGRD